MATTSSTANKTATTAAKKAATTAAKTAAKKAATTAAKTAKKPATAAKKPATTAKKPATTAAKKPAATAAKKTSSGSRIQVTATEKKLVELYRSADTDTKKAAMAILKGEKPQSGNILSSILEDSGLLGNLTDMIPGLMK